MLSKRQHEVLTLLADGLEQKEIAVRLGISPYTVRNLAVAIFDKLGVHNVAGAVAKALREGLIR